MFLSERLDFSPVGPFEAPHFPPGPGSAGSFFLRRATAALIEDSGHSAAISDPVGARACQCVSLRPRKCRPGRGFHLSRATIAFEAIRREIALRVAGQSISS